MADQVQRAHVAACYLVRHTLSAAAGPIAGLLSGTVFCIADIRSGFAATRQSTPQELRHRGRDG